MMTESWERLAGERLAEQYTLAEVLPSEGPGARFALRLGGLERSTAVAEVVPASWRGSGEWLNRYRFAGTLAHPNLLRVLDAGRTELGGAPVVYAIFERPEEALSDVLRERLLTAVEGRAVLEAITAALRYLHGKGVVYGPLRAGRIFAVADTIKLPVPPPVREEHGAADDVRELGLTLCEVLTGRRDTSRLSVECLPIDLERVIRGCLEAEASRRLTLEEIAAAPARVYAPPAATPQTPPLPRVARLPIWAYPALAVALILSAIFLFRGHRAPAPAVVKAPAVTTPRPAPPAIPRPRPSPFVPAERGAPRVWRVVVYTYGSRSAAEKMVARLRQQHAAWEPEVFSPRPGVYYVALGGRMTRAEARQMQHRARAAGMPRDTFARNFSR